MYVYDTKTGKEFVLPDIRGMRYAVAFIEALDALASYQALIQFTEQASNHDNQDFILLGDLNLLDIK
ncbi:hypothetical protein QYM36_006601 [Artemia franciscana]|uniref:Uncharacterized protein n=1 Tax=Artemia franciscana TaxID=6661 RepID=A0AA88L5P2_ARTSF|nr:hypothetical protein QYM36_006601 [Artemia franciscana]